MGIIIMYENIDYMLIGQKIKRLRSMNYLTQEKMAEICDISTSYLGHIERGSRKLSLETAYKIANCFNISLDSLIIDGIIFEENILHNIEAIIKKQSETKRNNFIKIIKILAENIEDL